MFKVTFTKSGFIQRVLFFEVATEQRAQELAELRGGEPAKPVLRRMRGKGNKLEWYVIFGIQRCRVDEWYQVRIPSTVEEFNRGNGFSD